MCIALKAITGTALVMATLSNGVVLGGCPPDVNCLVTVEFYAMRFDFLSVGTAMLGAGLLMSVFKDSLFGAGSLKLLGRNVESIAIPVEQHPFFRATPGIQTYKLEHHDI